MRNKNKRFVTFALRLFTFFLAHLLPSEYVSIDKRFHTVLEVYTFLYERYAKLNYQYWGDYRLRRKHVARHSAMVSFQLWHLIDVIYITVSTLNVIPVCSADSTVLDSVTFVSTNWLTYSLFLFISFAQRIEWF